MIFYGKKTKMIYLAEHLQVFLFNKYKTLIKNDLDKNLKNVFDKISILYRKKNYYNLGSSLNILKLISSVVSKNAKK